MLSFTKNTFLNTRFERDATTTLASARINPEHIELVRSDLMNHSEAVRAGLDTTPEITARRLAEMALAFASSEAPAFEQSATLSQTYGNFLAAKIGTRHVRIIRRLAHNSLLQAYPKSAPDPFTRNLNNLTRKSYRRAAKSTTPDKPFSLALEEAWEKEGMAIDPLIQETEAIILESYRQRRKQQSAAQETGAFALPNFDD